MSVSMYSRFTEGSIDGFGSVKETSTQNFLDNHYDNSTPYRKKTCKELLAKHWQWVFFSAISSICFAVSNYLIGKSSHEGFFIRPFIMVGNLIVAVIFILYYYCVKSGSLQGLLCDFQLIHLEFSGVNYHMLLDISIDAILLIGGEYLLIFTFHQSLRATINQGVISSLFVLSSVITAIISWVMVKIRTRVNPIHSNYFNFLQRERCNRYHAICAILVGCSFFILTEIPAMYYQSDLIHTIFILTILTSLYFSAKDMLFKARIIKYFLSPHKLYSLIICLGGIFMLITSAVLVSIYGFSQIVWDSFIAGILQSCAIFSMIFSLMRETKGWTPLIISYCFIIHALLAMWFLEQWLDWIQIIVLVLTSICVCITCVG
ncbi:unnamed protein product [Moneuplotes crassus]|uniref:Uncharacterized protein n=1 Tax=Euplotes crassus TaxID=5936 RepID=A0AAD1XGV8_EUPCR|nr:unnamed protein product [Moneuplotes crassus]